MNATTLDHVTALHEQALRTYPGAKSLGQLQEVADELHSQLRATGKAVVSFAPGNASQIVLVITELGEIGRSSLGGLHLVAIPNFMTPRIAVMNLAWDVSDLDVVSSRGLNLLSGDAPFVAIVLSLVAARLSE